MDGMGLNGLLEQLLPLITPLCNVVVRGIIVLTCYFYNSFIVLLSLLYHDRIGDQ